MAKLACTGIYCLGNVHHESCPLSGQTPVVLKDITYQVPGNDARINLSGEMFFYTPTVSKMAEALGFKVKNDKGFPMGISETDLIKALSELMSHRDDRNRLREFLNHNFSTQSNPDPGDNPVTTAIRIMNDARTVIMAAWPHILNLWDNVSRVLRNAGVIPPR